MLGLGSGGQGSRWSAAPPSPTLTLKAVRTAELSPFIVFIAPTDQGAETEALRQLRADSDAIRGRYAHLFDLSLVHNGVEETLGRLCEAFDRACADPQWVPVSWVY